MDQADLAELLAAARRDGAALDTVVPPATLAEGYLVAAQVVARLGIPVGWKIGATSDGAMAFLKVAEPIYGRVFEVVDSGSCYVPRGPRPVDAEPELILYTDAAGHVVRARLGLEIVRPSHDDVFALGAAFIVADNAANVVLVLGPDLPLVALDDPAAIRVALSVDGKAHFAGDASGVLGDPRRAVAWLAGTVGAANIAGQPVSSGAITRAVQLAPGNTVVADFGRWGAVSLTIGA